jgi:hypothetical protein
MRIVSFDPGGTTGYTFAQIYGLGDPSANTLLKVDPDQSKLTHYELDRLLAINLYPDVIICESFEYRNRARAGLVLVSCELIGVIKLYSQQYNVPLFMQTAAQGKGHFKDEIIKNMGLWIKGKPHAMDSLRHVLQWFTFGSGFQYNRNAEIQLTE